MRSVALADRRGAAEGPDGCDGGGWIVTLDRDRYKAPGTAEMVRFTRCICLDDGSFRLLGRGQVPRRKLSCTRRCAVRLIADRRRLS